MIKIKMKYSYLFGDLYPVHILDTLFSHDFVVYFWFLTFSTIKTVVQGLCLGNSFLRVIIPSNLKRIISMGSGAQLFKVLYCMYAMYSIEIAELNREDNISGLLLKGRG